MVRCIFPAKLSVCSDVNELDVKLHTASTISNPVLLSMTVINSVFLDAQGSHNLLSRMF